MPIVYENGTVHVIFGVGDVAITVVEDTETGHPYVAFSPLDKEFKQGEQPTLQDAMVNPPLLCLTSVNKAGIDNLIQILSGIRGKVTDMVEWPDVADSPS